MRILFVCLGNICRSPLAEGIMLHLNDLHALNWEIDSAGTAGYHIGEAPDQRTINNAALHGVDLRPLRARQFQKEDFDRFDHILVMDRNNYTNVLRLSQLDSHRNKVRLFLETSLSQPGAEVPDPYYGTEADFEKVFQLVWKGCEGLMRNFEKKDEGKKEG